MSTKTLRPYQFSAVQALFDWLYRPDSGHPLVVAPVGAGKSLLIADFIRQAQEAFPRTRIVVLTHVKELLVQNADELRSQYPDADFGFYCAGLGQKRLHNDITFASIQSVHNKLTKFNRCPELILIDECHLISHNDATQYRKFIDAVLAVNPKAKVIGFTGTPFRADTGRLDEGDGKLFDGIAYEIPMLYMIEQGYWARPVTPAVSVELSADGVKTSKGDYIASQLEKAVDIDEKTQACVREIIAKAGNRKRWFGMTAGVQHCEHVRDALRAQNIACEMITADTDPGERSRIIGWFKEVPTADEPPRALVNVGTLNIGFNAPYIDLLFPMRPTRSPVLYIQYVGRGVRPVYASGFDLNTQQGRLDAIAASPKPDCMILDFGGIVNSLGPIDAIDIRKKYQKPDPDREKGDGITKRCPSCGDVCAAAQRYCYSCSYSFVNQSIAQFADSTNAMLTIDEPVRSLNVLDMSTRIHYKKGDPNAKPTMKVVYFCMDGTYSEYICFEHSGYARDKAVHWHKQRLPDIEPPSTIEEALMLNYPVPSMIEVRREGRFDRVLNCSFTEKVNDLLDDEFFYQS